MFCADASCLQEVDCLGRSAVIYAVQFSCLDTLQILLEQGANVNAIALGQLPVYLLPFLSPHADRRDGDFAVCFLFVCLLVHKFL